MNLSRIYLVAILLMAFVACANGQESPKAILVDEFDKPGCEDLWSRLDAFAHDIKSKPTSKITVEISGKKDDTVSNFYWDSMIRGYFRWRNIPDESWKVVRTKLGDERHVRFWLTPEGASEPQLESAEWPMTFPPGMKPFVYTNGESYSVEVGVCLYVDEIGLLSKALDSNPTARLNVVVIVRNDREFVRRKRGITKMLVNDYSINKSRIRFFKQISRMPNPYGIDPKTEYWLLP